MYSAPVDFSFQSITSVADAQEPRAGLRPLRKNKENKYLCGSLRLNNNDIAELSNFLHNVSCFLAEPRKLAWLDLSFNSMSHIDTVLCELQELRVLYLHGNNIYSLSEVDKLGELLHLHTITLHGNLIENQPGYRSHIISVLPYLKKVDFSAVTGQEKAMAKIWHRHDRTHPSKLTIQQSAVHRTSA